MKTKIQIKSMREKLLFEFEKEDNSLKDTIEEAMRNGVNLTKAYLAGANLAGAYLAGAYLTGAYLAGANLTGANLAGAYLTGAYLTGANLTGANLTGAYLTGANLAGANLAGANLAGAYLTGAYLAGAKNISKFLTTPLLFLLDQPGLIYTYKLVNKRGEGIYAANNGYIPINYLDAEEFAVESCNQDDTVECGAGISLATLDWCVREWQPGYRILVMEFRAADIAAIPIATDGKFRVKRCRRVGEKDLKELGLVK